MGLISGVIVSKLRELEAPGGNVYQSMSAMDPGYKGFGEAYFSTINGGEIKSWKLHKRVTLNLTVIRGLVRFVLVDLGLRPNLIKGTNEFILGRGLNYSRLTVPPGLWMAFQGISPGENIILNIIDHPHDPAESERRPIEHFYFDWTRS